MKEKRSSLLGGVAILSIAGILSKIIGMAFRVPLTNMIGSGGISVYQTVYPTYTLLLTLSTAGIPVAISRLVSESVALSRHKNARAILRTALLLLFAVGTLLSILLFLLAGPLSNFVSTPEAAPGYRAIAPSILIVSLMSALRGYMQGRSQMLPTAVSQLVEQIAKVLISLPLATAGAAQGVAEAATGALVGITISEGLALLYMYITYMVRRRHYIKLEASDDHEASSFSKLCGTMVRIAVPITIGSAIVPVAGFIDAAMIKNRLIAAGIDEIQAGALYGLQNGAVLSLVNVVTVLATAVCIGLVPLISAARVEGRKDDMLATSAFGLRLGSLIGLPSSIGMSMLATPIIRLLYPALPAEEIIMSGEILSLSALTIFFFTQVQSTTGILQGAGLHKIPMYTLVAGVICKALMNFVLIAIPSINILGAPLASLSCYLVSMVINLYFISKKLGLKLDMGSILVRPAIATAGMGVVVLILMQALNMDSRFSVLLVVLAALIVYFVLIFAVGALRREDMEQIPGGNLIEKLMIRMGVWRI